MAKRKRIRSQKAAAEQLGVEDRTLRNWEKEAWWNPGFVNASGYDVAAIKQARDVIGRKGSEQSDQSKRLKLATDAEKLRQAQFKTRREELAVQQEEGQLLPRQSVELHFATFLTAQADFCDQLPELIAGEVPKKHRRKLKDRLKAELDKWRRSCRDELERAARELDDKNRKDGKGTK